jgi:hypothetical protein
MDIMEPRRLEAWREHSRWLKASAFIGGEVWAIAVHCASLMPANSRPSRAVPARRAGCRPPIAR